jgi:hypothetical protein
MILLKFLLFSFLASASQVYISGCTVFDSKFDEIHRFPGQYCVFLNNGNYLSSLPSEGDASLINPHGNVLWKKKLYAHHQLKQDSDGNFLLMTSEIVKYQNKDCRSDNLVIVGQDGKTLKEWKFFDHSEEIRKLLSSNSPMAQSWLWIGSWFNDSFPSVKCEVSHINSIYEIPENAMSKQLGAFKKGNYIVNSSYGFVLILSRDFKKILWFKEYPGFFPASRLHDVQVLSSGNILAYVNKVDMKRESYLAEYNPVTGDAVWKYGGNPAQHFFSGYSGGVQILGNGTLLFSDLSDYDAGEKFIGAKIKVINRSGELLINKPYLIRGFNYAPQEIKEINIDDFLKNNKAPI